MKKLKQVFGIFAVVALLASCASMSTNSKDIKYMPLRFKPLAKTDYTLVGDLSTEITISGKGSSKGKLLDKEYANNYKKGLISKSEATEIMYFAPGNGESVTGQLYENEVFNAVYSPVVNGRGPASGFFANLIAKYKKYVPMPADPGMEFAYYALIGKYPDVDYFINVRFDRKIVVKGKKFTETVLVKADGVKLRVDM